MPGRLAGKTCLISGATGIAAATAELAAREGASLFIASVGEEECEQLAGTLRDLGAGCGYAVADLTEAAAVAAAVDACIERFQRIDALYNVAGISGRRYGDGPLHECTEEGWDMTIKVNLKSMYLLSRQVLNRMLTQPVSEAGLRGAILNMASVVARHPEPRHFATHAYAASKGAIIAMSRAMAAYYAPHKIRVNAIAPGLVRTPMSRRAQSDQALLEFMHAKQALSGALLEAEDVARASVFLLGDESRHITGQVLTVDGGWSVS